MERCRDGCTEMTSLCMHHFQSVSTELNGISRILEYVLLQPGHLPFLLNLKLIGTLLLITPTPKRIR